MIASFLCRDSALPGPMVTCGGCERTIESQIVQHSWNTNKMQISHWCFFCYTEEQRESATMKLNTSKEYVCIATLLLTKKLQLHTTQYIPNNIIIFHPYHLIANVSVLLWSSYNTSIKSNTKALSRELSNEVHMSVFFCLKAPFKCEGICKHTVCVSLNI